MASNKKDNITVVIQTGLLAVMGWIGVNIDQMKTDIAAINTSSVVNKVEIARNIADISDNKVGLSVLNDTINEHLQKHTK